MKIKTLITVIIYIAVFLVLIGVVGIVVMFVNNGQKNFYVQYGDEKISYSREGLELPKGAGSVFYCRNVLGFSEETVYENSYTVRVQYNKELIEDFDFTVDGIEQGFYGGVDITEGFDIERGQGFFMIYLPETLTMQSLLSAVYKDKTVEGVPEINLYEKDYLNIVVYCGKDKTSITIGFH